MKSPALLLTMLCFTAFAHAEPTPPEKLNLRSADIFAALLKHHGLLPLERPVIVNPRDTVLVFFGRMPAFFEHESHYVRLSRQCLAEGGAVLFVTDQPTNLTPYLHKPAGTLFINGEQVLETDRARQHRFQEEFPILRMLRPTVRGAVANDLNADLMLMLSQTRVAANLPSFITGTQPLKPLAEYSTTAVLQFGKTPPPGPAMAMLPSETNQLGVILADAGVLSTQWLAGDPEAKTPALQNFEFASHLANFLVNGPDGNRRRTQVLLVEDGIIRTNYDRVQFAPNIGDLVPNAADLASGVDPKLLSGAQPSWAMIQQSFAKGFDDKLNDLQQRDWPTKLLPKPQPGVPYRAGDANRDTWRDILQKIGGGLAVIAVILVLRRMMNQRRDGEPVLPCEPSTAFGPLTLRQEARKLVRDRRLHELLPGYLKGFLDRWAAGDEMSLAADGPASYRRLLAADLQRMRVAVRTPPKQVTGKQWRAWQALTARLDDDHATGRWHFIPHSEGLYA